jgi:uncharacterized protein GlcG (DUF336 family)
MALITLAQAEKIIDAVIARARELRCRPISVVVVEPGAIVKAFKKEDGSAMMRFDMAMGKAYAALALGRSSSLVHARTEHRPLFMDFLFKASQDRIFAEGGGLLITRCRAQNRRRLRRSRAPCAAEELAFRDWRIRISGERIPAILLKD